MGVPFRIFLPSSRVYTCSACSTHLAADEDVISRSFHGRIGRAYLFERATNVLRGEPESRSLLSGIHKVADLHCRVCNQVLGWVYIEAQQDSQKYKEVDYHRIQFLPCGPQDTRAFFKKLNLLFKNRESKHQFDHQVKMEPALARAFDNWDRDKDGTIDKSEWMEKMKTMTDLEESKLEEFWSKADKNGDGMINKEEFVFMQKDLLEIQEKEKQIQGLWILFDLDGNGYLSKSEFTEMCEELEVEFPKSAGDADGKVMYKEFHKVMFDLIEN